MSVNLTVLIPAKADDTYLSESLRSIMADEDVDCVLLITHGWNYASSNFRISDPRLSTLAVPGNYSFVEILNHGIKNIETELISRLDADDIWIQGRAARIKSYSRRYSEFAIFVGQSKWIFGGNSSVAVNVRKGIKPGPAKLTQLLFGNSFTHSASNFRTSWIKKNLYNDLVGVEDYDLWVRNWGKILILPEVDCYYRKHSGQITKSKNVRPELNINQIKVSQMAWNQIKFKQSIYGREGIYSKYSLLASLFLTNFSSLTLMHPRNYIHAWRMRGYGLFLPTFLYLISYLLLIVKFLIAKMKVNFIIFWKSLRGID